MRATCFHLSDGTIILGEMIDWTTETIITKNVFVLTKIKQPSQYSLIGEPESVRVVLTKYDSFNHEIDSSVELMKSGVISKYTCDEDVTKLYNDFVIAQAEQIASSPNPNAADSFSDMISKVLNETKTEPKLSDFEELRKNTIRTRKPKAD